MNVKFKEEKNAAYPHSNGNLRFYIGDFFLQNFTYARRHTLTHKGNTYLTCTQRETGVTTTERICKADMPKNKKNRFS